jgi:hypothetical protein
MSAEARRVLILGILAVVLGGYAYVTTPEKKTLGTENAKKADRPALDFIAEKVKQLDIVFEGKQLICQRTATGWVEPSSGASVRQDAIDDFLSNLQKLLNLGEVEGGMEQIAEFGLQPPVARIKMEVEGEGTRVLALGKNNPVQTSLYAQVNDTPQVVLVGSVVVWDMRKLFSAAGLAG